jgi:hypothetical protein
MRSSTADINPECGIAPKQSATSVSTTQRAPANDSFTSTCSPSCAARFGRNLNAERSFRRIKGYNQMPHLVDALRRHTHPKTTAGTETVRAAA